MLTSLPFTDESETFAIKIVQKRTERLLKNVLFTQSASKIPKAIIKKVVILTQSKLR